MSSIGKEFLEKTKEKYFVETDQEKGLPRPPFELEYDRSKPIIELPKPEHIKLKDKHLRECIEKRRSLRDYSSKPLSPRELSYLLWCTQGVKEVTPKNLLRNVPSAGARHPFETYILVKNVKGLKPGVYRFIGTKHSLIAHNLDEGIAQKIKDACSGQSLFDPCAVVFMWAAIAERMTWRYWERGYRYILIDAGHVCQNLYLAAESINCGACAVASYDDDELNKLLGLDGVNQFVVYLGVAGKR
ncbi:MAG: SagB/ThcOx family dehydrogenase [Ignavibacteria bacterium]|jgi:SagB-type dehydrogenase family enzyme